MEIKREINENGQYHCDIDISVAEWKEILQNREVTTLNYLDTLLKFYAEPEHKATCKTIGEKYNVHPQRPNSLITNFAIAVQKNLNRFTVIDSNGNPTYWIIPMKGKKLKNGLFEWTIREELAQAIQELNLMEKQFVKFESFYNLLDIINEELGDFTETFRYKRKELANKRKASARGILFTYAEYNLDRNWAINEGGGIEVQYHIYLYENKIGFGIGFNTEYTPFNKVSPLEYMQPFADAYLELKSSEIVKQIKSNGFSFIEMSEEELKPLVKDTHYLLGRTIDASNNKISLQDFNGMIYDLKTDLFELYCAIFEKRNQLLGATSTNMEYIELLKANKNLIFTGAPGTGKTYLAKQIAKEMNAETEFVQFHPSYDYTDFVEGLRPVKKDSQEIGFELKDGIFKTFCKKALKANFKNEVDNFDEAWEELLAQIRDNLSKGNLTKIGSWEYSLSTKDSLKYSSTNTPSQYNFTITKQNVYAAYQNKKARPSGAFQKDMEDIVAYMKEHFELKDFQKGSVSDQNTDFIFIIDEINRAEISKVFGELFFSIDPGYRGVKGKVKTQYSNLQEESDVFADGFYIPENVYIIGTMNDIDRSVESMDFAMRRRFAWQEITAEDSLVILNEIKDETARKESQNKLLNLNAKIDEIPELGKDYHIGASYFLKLNTYSNDFSKLWNNHLKGILFEYLRGLPDSEELLRNLETAYNNTEKDVENNG